MNRLEKHTLETIIRNCQGPSVPGTAMDANFRTIPQKPLVDGIANTDLLSDPRFQAGYRRCFVEFQERLQCLFLNPSSDNHRKEQLKYAGHPKKEVKAKS